MKDNKRIIKTRHDFIWHYALVHLECLMGMGVMYDEKFKNLYQNLYDYVAGKCAVQIEGDIIDFYVVVEKYAPQND